MGEVNVRAFAALLALALLATTSKLSAADWPQFLGPRGTGASDETANLPLRELWRVETGPSWAAPTVAGGKVYVFHRTGEREELACLDAATGKKLWAESDAAPYEDAYGAGPGPRATPLVAGGAVYTLGVAGRLTARDAATGTRRWTRDLAADFHPEQRDLFFGVGMSPVLEGNLLLIGIGGSDGAGIVGLDAATGKTVWTATNDGPSYSTPLCATIGGTRLAFVLTRAGLVCLEPATGAVRWTRPFRSRMGASVNAATPVLVGGDHLFVTSAYDTGGMMLAVDGREPRELWRSDALGCHFATPLAVGGFLYGFDGRYDVGASKLACVDAATGKAVWTEPSQRKGTLIRAGERFLVLAEGRLTVAEMSPKGFTAGGSTEVLPGPTWTAPALADGRLYVRNERTLVCLAVTAK